MIRKVKTILFKLISIYYHYKQSNSEKYLYKGGCEYKFNEIYYICYLYSICELEGDSICWTVILDNKTNKIYLHKYKCDISYLDYSIKSNNLVVFEEEHNYYHDMGVSSNKRYVCVKYPNYYEKTSIYLKGNTSSSSYLTSI